jgi:hypothetical protein
MITNRKDAREALYSVLSAGLSSASVGYAYGIHNLEGASPAFYLTSSGTSADWLTGKGFHSKFYINVHLLALYAIDDNYTEQMAEDALDTLESELRAVLTSNKKTADWQNIAWAERSRADAPINIGGAVYLHEIVPLVLEAF